MPKAKPESAGGGNNVNRRTQIQQVFLLVMTVMGLSLFAEAASTTVWQIGKFDKSSLEFNQAAPKPGAAQAPNDLVYVIGKSQPEPTGSPFSRARPTARQGSGRILTPSSLICLPPREDCTR